MRKIMLWAAALCGIVLLVGGLYFYGSRSGHAPLFRLAKVQQGSITSTVSPSGTLTPVITVVVGSQISGQIKEILVDFNSEVREGQTIARIDPESFDSRVCQAEAELAVARSEVVIQAAAVERARAELENARSALSGVSAQVEKARVAVWDARRDLDRKERLRKGSIISQSDIDKAKAAYDQAEAQLRTAEAEQEAQASVVRSRKAALRMAEGEVVHAEAQVAQREATLHQSRIDLSRTIIRSPVDGVVIERNVDVGQTVAASLQAPVLFNIAKDLLKMQVETSVDEADIGRIQVGQKATFTVDAFPGHEFRGEVEQIRKAPLTVQNVVTYTVIISADNPDLRLLPGMTANVAIIVEEHADIRKVPNAALRFKPPAGNAPYVADSGPGTPGAFHTQGRQEVGERLSRLIEVLDLDKNQQTRIRALFTEAKVKIADMRRKGASPDEIRMQAANLREKGRAALLSILNEDQQKKYAQISMRKNSPSRQKGRVWIVGEGGRASPVQVTTGISDGSFTEIVSGNLTAGQEVIVGMDRASSPAAPKKRFRF